MTGVRTDTVPAAEALADLIGGVSVVVAGSAPGEQASWLFTRCLLSATRFEDHGRDEADLDAALADFAALPEDLPGRAKLAATLVVAQLRAGVLDKPERFAVASSLAAIANADPQPLPQWPQAFAVVQAGALMRGGMTGAPGFRPRAALQELERHAETVGELRPHVTIIDMARLVLRQLVAQEDGNVSEATQLVTETAGLADQFRDDPPLSARAEVVHTLMKGQAAALRGDLTGAATAAQEALEKAGKLSPGDHLRQQIDNMRDTLEPLLQMMQPGGPLAPGTLRTDTIGLGTGTRPHLGRLEDMAMLPGLDDTERAVRLATLGTAELGSADTPPALDRAVEHLSEAVEASPGHDPRRVYYLMSLGVGHLRRLDVTGRRDDLPAATSALERARELAGSSAHAYWATCSNPLAHAYRLSGRRHLGRQVALSGLRGHAWTVLLQSSSEDIQDAARHAAEDAVDVARWCLEDDDPESAATALDAGRGLILYAATETRDVETRLTEVGEGRLAAQWRQALATSAPSDVPTELRRRVIAALAGIPLAPDGSTAGTPASGPSRLLDPPTVHEVRAALRTLGADALVYLLPGDQGDGAAVVVPVDEQPSWMRLPKLNLRAVEAFDEHVAAGGPSPGPATAYGADEVSRGSVHRSRAVLEQICDWAWDAAIGPLLEEHLAMPAGSRPVRLILIPMRELARVPWHAARHRVAGRPEYAVRRAVFSYAASARLLCESAWRSDVPLSGAGLVVGDPDPQRKQRDLPAARSEALAIRTAFYPDARYVGRRADGLPAPDGAGTVDDVLRWLADSEGGTMAHLACHAVVQSGTGADSSYLLLAGGELLSAEELIRRMTAGPGRDIALAVLAACSSAESGRGYDEAFSLGTAFVAGGARSVISAQWSVADAPTSLLMFAVHHFLRVEGLRPVDALHEAQLWMILDRHPLETMPEELREHLAGPVASDLATWAAFVHFGR